MRTKETLHKLAIHTVVIHTAIREMVHCKEINTYGFGWHHSGAHYKPERRVSIDGCWLPDFHPCIHFFVCFCFSIDFQKAETGITLVLTAWWTLSMNTFSKTRNRRTHFDQKNGKLKTPLGQHFPKTPKSDNILRQFLFTVWSLDSYKHIHSSLY